MWHDTELFLQMFCGPLPTHRLKAFIENSVKLSETVTLSELELSTFFLTEIKVEQELGKYAEDIGLTPASLRDSSFEVFCSQPCNGLILELEKFRSKEKMPFCTLQMWMEQLTLSGTDILTPFLRKRVLKAKDVCGRLRKKPWPSQWVTDFRIIFVRCISPEVYRAGHHCRGNRDCNSKQCRWLETRTERKSAGSCPKDIRICN